jgi:hypothetical protein
MINLPSAWQPPEPPAIMVPDITASRPSVVTPVKPTRTLVPADAASSATIAPLFVDELTLSYGMQV